MMQKWEYLSQYLWANKKPHENYLNRRFPSEKMGKFTPKALIPELDTLGEQGWELIHIEPVFGGKNSDIAMAWGDAPRTVWTNQYFCVFKRLKQEDVSQAPNQTSSQRQVQRSQPSRSEVQTTQSTQSGSSLSDLKGKWGD